MVSEEAFVVLVPLLRLALEALWLLLLLLSCSSIGFGLLVLSSVLFGLWLCSWLVEATLWDFFNRV